MKASTINYLVDAGPLIGFLDRDATLVVLSELLPRAKLITLDDDFRRYRRLRNQAIPLVMPEGR